MASGPNAIAHRPPVPLSQESSAPPPTMRAKPNAIRRSKFSWKTNQASSAVNTPSMFKSREAADAGVELSPDMRRTGPTTPPANTAPASHGTSARVMGASPAETGNSNRVKNKPRPEPA